MEDILQQISELFSKGEPIPDELKTELVAQFAPSIRNKETFTDKYSKIRLPGQKTSKLGEGGNANAYLVSSLENGEVLALKHLRQLEKQKKERFLEEIDIVLKYYKVIEGILPILDYDRDAYWYTMPIAEPILAHIKKNNSNIKDIVQEYLLLVHTFIELHQNGIAHRDVKPDNIYYYQNRYYIGDFGLVNYPDKNHKNTKSNRGIGAIFTIAPEMKRDPSRVKDARKADVYSLAKTLWMLITRDEKGFDGQYDYTNSLYALRLHEKYRHTHLVELEQLLRDCTDDNPDNRPSIEDVYKRLCLWLKICSKLEWSAASDWQFLNRLIFKDGAPCSVTWNDRGQIVDILKKICQLPTRNHVIFSSGGGHDMTDVSYATEEGCICIEFGEFQTSILKPKRLYYETFGKDSAWNYLMLELDELEPVFGLSGDLEDESLDEDYPGHYVSAKDFCYGVYSYEGGVPLPPTARLVCRYVKGRFLIVLKTGHYNYITETYDGRHGSCSIAEFREYIEGMINVSHASNATKEDKAIAISKVQKPEEIALDLMQHEKGLAPKDFLKNHVSEWNFAELFPRKKDENPSMLYQAKASLSCNYNPDWEYDPDWLLENGKIGKETEIIKPYLFTSREEMIACSHSIEHKVLEYVKEFGYRGLDLFEHLSFDPILKPCIVPTHLFTKKEIEELMRMADDREYNRLVIDEFGYAHIIHREISPSYYPVSHYNWEPGNNTVGKYSDLDDLESTYIDCLSKWLLYLETGEHQCSDYCRSIDVMETIRKITTYYK